jgi:hypothetical protein
MQSPMSASELHQWAVSVVSSGGRRLGLGASKPAS